MSSFLKSVFSVFGHAAPYVWLFVVAFVTGLITVPFVREMNRKFGMVDAPGPRRINQKPIPRGGGLAVIFSVTLAVVSYLLVSEEPLFATCSNGAVVRLTLLAWVLAAVGYADDRFSLPPLAKLGGQLLVAIGAFFFADVGFHTIFPALPTWLDCCLTVFWITGAVNAFNLIDGLDGLATGLALIAAAGMAGVLFLVGGHDDALMLFAFMGACLAFLKYNFHPASVFLGDTGSMYLGFMLAVFPLVVHRATNSLFISIGVPLLAMGVPIFDTSLAILRRSLRAILKKETALDAGNSHVMTADTDHLHHRILRHVVSQKKAAWMLYLMALFLVGTGIAIVALRERGVGLFILAFVVAVVIVFRDMQRVELWDFGRILDVMAHDTRLSARRHRAALAVPFFVGFDILALVLAYVLAVLVSAVELNSRVFSTWLPLRVVTVFLALVAFRVYRTAWSRAQTGNYFRLILAVIVGVVAGVAGAIFAGLTNPRIVGVSCLYGGTACAFLAGIRLLRGFVRDLIYAVDCHRLIDAEDTKRILAVGGGLRYRAFRRELVRASAKNRRLILGILDDDILLKDRYIGGVKVLGRLEDAPALVKEMKIDEVVIVAEMTPARIEVAKKLILPTGARLCQWTFVEHDLSTPTPNPQSSTL